MKNLNDLLVAGDAERVDYSELSREEREALGDNASKKDFDKARVDKIVKEQGVNEGCVNHGTTHLVAIACIHHGERRI